MILYKDFLPKDVDISNEFKNYFGGREFEIAIVDILKYLKNGKSVKVYSWEENESIEYKDWYKIFYIDTFPNIDTSLFCMLCAAGWIENNWIPKSFKVSKELIKRIYNKQYGR